MLLLANIADTAIELLNCSSGRPMLALHWGSDRSKLQLVPGGPLLFNDHMMFKYITGFHSSLDKQPRLSQ